MRQQRTHNHNNKTAQPKNCAVLLAGEESFELSAYGFGDRRSTN